MACKILKLTKRSITGKTLVWKASIKKNEVLYSWGQEGGAIRKERRIYTEGTNIGKSNNKSPGEQCLFEAERKARKKVESGYTLIEGEFETISSSVILSRLDIPKPMLAKTFQDQKTNIKGWVTIYAQHKLDGNRALVNIKTGKIYSRNRKEITSIPELGNKVKEVFSFLLDEGIEWVDGELYSDELTFNQLQSIIRKSTEIDPKAFILKFYCFDIISSKGFAERYVLYSKMIETERVKKVKSEIVEFNSIEQLLYRYYSEEGAEGIILRHANTPYEQKRSGSLIKYKGFVEDEFEIIGWEAEDLRPNLFGSFYLKTNFGAEFKARPACTKEEKEVYFKIADSLIGKKATIQFQDYTEDNPNGVPRFPVFKGVRDDI